MIKRYKKYILTPLLIVITSCTEVIEVEVPNNNKRLVVEASINWEKGTSGNSQEVKLRKSTDFFDTKDNPPITNAIVTIVKENDRQTFEFIHQKDGIYKTDEFIPEKNAIYTLKIEYDGQEYQAKESLVPVNKINKIEQTVQASFNEDITRLEFFYDDPKGVENYYLGKFITYETPPYLSARNDRFSDGNENSMSYFDEDIESGSVVNFTLYGISKRYYNYMNLLINQSQDTGNPFGTTPIKLIGNCKNINNPNEEVLGYFRLCEMVKEQYTVQ